MELPIELKLASEGLAMGMSQGLMTDSAKELSRRYMSESGTGKSLLTKSNEALVYSLMRMPGTFGAVASILEQVCMLSDFIPRSLLDAGAGTGTGVAKLIAEQQGNVVKLEHNQFVSINRNAEVELRITLEAFGEEHKERICEKLAEAGYKPKIVRTNL